MSDGWQRNTFHVQRSELSSMLGSTLEGYVFLLAWEKSFMTISNILGFVAIAGVLMLLAGAALAVQNVAQGRPARAGLGLALAGLIIAVLFGIASLGVVVIGP